MHGLIVLLFLFSLRPSHFVLSFPRAGEVASIAVFFVCFFFVGLTSLAFYGRSPRKISSA